MDNESIPRREFLKDTASLLPVTTATTDATQSDTQLPSEDSFQPESFWQDRMQPPDDGKNYGWFIDTRRCFGCHACEVSCKAENDVPLGHFIRQTFYKDVGQYPKVARMFLPMACQHCEDAPCIKACPCGALHKESGGTVAIDYNLCCGHATCVDVCPYGAIYIDPVAKQAVKCHNCYHRTEEGMEPACVPTCPSEALYFGDLNDPNTRINKAMEQVQETVELSQLRTEKKTNPKMWFAGSAAAEVESDIPREGHSYSTEVYSVHNWKKQSSSNHSEIPD